MEPERRSLDWNRVGRWTLLGGSVVLGTLGGWGAYLIFEAKVPAAMQTSILKAEARLYYLVAGAVFGLAILVWARVAIRIASWSTAARVKRELADRTPPPATS